MLVKRSSSEKNALGIAVNLHSQVIDYLAMLILVCISGNTFFNFNGKVRTVLVVAFLAFLVLLLLRGELKFSIRFSILIAVFGFLFLFQWNSFSFFPVKTIGGFYIKIIIGYFACCLIRNFPVKYVNTLFWICAISLFFFFTEHIFRSFGYEISNLFRPFFPSVGAYDRIHIGVYYFFINNRNCGMFWEPGAMAGYLLIALVFLGLRKDSFSTKDYWVKLIVLYIGVLTTFSTFGYLALPFVLFLLFKRFESPRLKVFLSFALFYILFISVEYAFYKIHAVQNRRPESQYYQRELYRSNIHGDFIFKKISSHLRVLKRTDIKRHRNRFDDISYDMQYVRQRPITGWGINKETRYLLHPDEKPYIVGHGCGLSDYIVKFGAVGFIVLIVYLWQSCYFVSGGSYLKAALALVLLLLVFAGEGYMRFSIFFSLMLLAGQSENLNKPQQINVRTQ